MKYRALDKNDDYSFGRRLFLTGREAVGQAILTRMRLLYAEWWENLEDGLPLFEKILGSYGGDDVRQAVDLIISERIQGTRDVKEITHYESTFENRRYEAFCAVNTVYGTATVSLSDNMKQVEVHF